MTIMYIYNIKTNEMYHIQLCSEGDMQMCAVSDSEDVLVVSSLILDGQYKESQWYYKLEDIFQ